MSVIGIFRQQSWHQRTPRLRRVGLRQIHRKVPVTSTSGLAGQGPCARNTPKIYSAGISGALERQHVLASRERGGNGHEEGSRHKPVGVSCRTKRACLADCSDETRGRGFKRKIRDVHRRSAALREGHLESEGRRSVRIFQEGEPAAVDV